MEYIQQGRRGVSVMVELGADRLLVPLAILLSLLGGAAIGLQLMYLQVPPANGIF